MAPSSIPHNGPIITRAEAKSKGLKRYFMGSDKPCKRGHVSERKTVDGFCIQCSRVSSLSADQIERKRVSSLKYAEQHRSEKNAQTAERYQRKKAADPEALRAKWRAYKAENKEAAAAHTKRWAEKNAEKLKAQRVANRDKIAERSKAWAKANPEKAREKTRRWQERNPEKLLAYRQANKEKIAQRGKAWKQANPEMVRANVRKWFAANPGVVQRWRKANPEAFRAQTQTRHARMANAEGRHTAADLKALLKQQNGRCGYCRKSIKTTWTVDHIQPLSRGGTNWISNIQLLCPSCNYSKQDADPIEFARRLGRLV